MASLAGQRFAVVGLAKSGLAAIELLLARGAQVAAFDDQAEVPAAEALRARGVSVALGGLPQGFWQGAAAVVVSPGVPWGRPELAQARDSGVPVFGEVELAFRCLPRGAGPILGVTGTNGKSTTTALLGELMRGSGRRTFVGGNLGRPFSEACHEPSDVHVVELSSFQLEGIDRAVFQGAAVLNLAPDHLDRYPTPEAYAAAKARIFKNQNRDAFAVVNADDRAVVALSRGCQAPVFGFTLDEHRSRTDFAGLARASGNTFAFDFGGAPTFQVGGRALRGAHNVQNAMAAALMASLAGARAPDIQRGLDGFAGLPHRLELVRELRGVEWINDSKATNVDSAVVAMRALSGPVWLIAGGKGKGAPYAPLVEAAKGKLAGVLTIGADAPAVSRAFAGSCPVHACETLERAVHRASELAAAGEVVLLAPACASYDQFRHFEHRGDSFKALVQGLK